MLFVIAFAVALAGFSPSLQVRALKRTVFMASTRVERTERPYIEDVLDKYGSIPNVTTLALGSSFWNPPESALNTIKDQIFDRVNQRYGNILGYPLLRDKLFQLHKDHISLDDMEVAVAAGANQAFFNLGLALCDASDNAIAVAPYYFSHLLTLQLCQCNVSICPFMKSTLEPDWSVLEEQVRSLKPKMVVITSPNNPSGLVWSEASIRRIIDLCKETSTWLVVDQTYHEFLFDAAKHTYPCGVKYNYDKIIHIFSLSKVFGMPGWRIGYSLYPRHLSLNLRKIQDTTITHASIISQQLAVACLDTYTADYTSNPWFEEHRLALQQVREALWPVVARMGTVKTNGAFYFLVPLPPGVSEDEAVDILATQFGVLLMHGSPFGAPGHLRMSYGSIPPEQIVSAISKISDGFDNLVELSNTRSGELSK